MVKIFFNSTLTRKGCENEQRVSLPRIYYHVFESILAIVWYFYDEINKMLCKSLPKFDQFSFSFLFMSIKSRIQSQPATTITMQCYFFISAIFRHFILFSHLNFTSTNNLNTYLRKGHQTISLPLLVQPECWCYHLDKESVRSCLRLKRMAKT